MAESERFELSKVFQLCRFSRPVLSTTQPTLHIGDFGRTRTCNLQIRSLLLYPVELRSHVTKNSCSKLNISQSFFARSASTTIPIIHLCILQSPNQIVHYCGDACKDTTEKPHESSHLFISKLGSERATSIPHHTDGTFTVGQPTLMPSLIYESL